MVMDVEVELRIKAMQPLLIPGPEQIHPALGVLDVGESTYQDLGSVNTPAAAGEGNFRELTGHPFGPG